MTLKYDNFKFSSYKALTVLFLSRILFFFLIEYFLYCLKTSLLSLNARSVKSFVHKNRCSVKKN